MGSSSTAKSPDEQLGLLVEDAAEAVEPVGDLLALVERERHVVTGALGLRVQLLGEAEQHGEAALHVGGAQPVQDVAVDPRHLVAVGRHGVEVATEHDPAVASELGARDDAGADRVDRERRRARPQPLLDDLRQLGFVVALRRHRDERGGEPEQVGRVVLEDTELSVTWRSRGRGGCR